VHKKDRDKD